MGRSDLPVLWPGEANVVSDRPVRYAGKRQVTGFVSEATYRKAIEAKLLSGKTLLELIEEGLVLAAEDAIRQARPTK